MPEIKRLFNASRMNRDVDDRLVQPGEYREALNINVSKSEGSDMGAVENVLGNKLVVNNGGLSDLKTIGQYRDNGNEKIYYFVTTNNTYNEIQSGSNKIIEYDQKSNKSTTLVDNAGLNFHQNYPITGINLVDNLLFFTDDRNPPRKINVETARNNTNHYSSLALIDNIISVAKYAPYSAATIIGVSNVGEDGTIITSNFLENKLIRFSYRYQFEDGEYSVLAPFTPICFSRLSNPDIISSDIQNFGEIETFVNAIKSVQLSISIPVNFGITGVELVDKETGSSTLYVVEKKIITTENSINFFYKSQDPFKTLPADQLTRVSDAVPKRAKSQELAGGRLIYGNYIQNFDIPQLKFQVTKHSDSDAKYVALDSNMSVKSRRTYQVGVVLCDKFGRQTPVILSEDGKDTVFVDATTGDASTAFQALRITFDQSTLNRLLALDWIYSYRIVVKQREQEYYNWISNISSLNVVDRFGDSINKIPRDQTAVIPPSTSNTISPCEVSVYPKILGNVNKTTSSLTKVQSINNPAGTANVPTDTINTGLCVFETEPVESDLDIFYETSTGGLISTLTTTAIDIQFYNCFLLTWTSGTHIEVNRLRAGFNEKAFDVGVRAYVVKENFAEERRFNTLIHSSGLFNSRTNVNYINQFNESEGGLTISLDPQDGSIQKLYADDTQIVVFQEDKLSRSPINKDFIYSAEGGAVPVTSNTQFLGTIAPYAGDFGISKNPQSFAAYGYSRYFTDKNRGSVMRLSQNGLVEISNSGMSDIFRDALKKSDTVIGSYDEYHGLYNLTLIGKGFSGFEDTNVATASDGYLTISFDENAKGWTSFKSFQQEGGISLNNIYYTFNGGRLWQHNDESVNRNSFYGAVSADSYIEPILNDSPSLIKTFNNISYEGTSGWELDFLKTDLNLYGTESALEDFNLITLQTGGSANNSIISGENSIYAKQNDVIEWVIEVKPKNSDFAFSSASDITMTGDTGLSITSPNAIIDNKLIFKVNYTAGTTSEIKTVTIAGAGATLVYTASILTVSIVDTLANASVSPGLQSYSAAGNYNLNVTTQATADYYIKPTEIISDIGSFSKYNIYDTSIVVNYYVKVIDYDLTAGTTNKYAIARVSSDNSWIETPDILLTKGIIHRFYQEDSSNTGHPLRIATAADAAGNTEFTTDVITVGTPGSTGAYTQITAAIPDATTPATLYYYCSNHTGMGGVIKKKDFRSAETNNYALLTFPLTATSIITSDVLGLSGTVLSKPELTWSTPGSGTLAILGGQSVNTAYKTSPYDSVNNRKATLSFTTSDNTKVFLLAGNDVTYNVAGAEIIKTVNNTQDALVFTITAPPQLSNKTLTPTITGCTVVTAAMASSIPTSPPNFPATGASNLVIGDAANEKANVPVLVTTDENWVTFNGSYEASGVTVDPDGLSFAGHVNYPLNINVLNNTTNATRTATVTIANANSRVTGLSNQTINITQTA